MTTVGLLTRIARIDTIKHFEQASLERLKDSRALKAGKRYFWAIYTMGYVVEICLKAAFFRLYGLSDTDDAKEALKIAAAVGKRIGPYRFKGRPAQSCFLVATGDSGARIPMPSLVAGTGKSIHGLCGTGNKTSANRSSVQTAGCGGKRGP